MEAIIDTLAFVFYVLFSAWCMSNAIRDFKRQRYFLCSYYVMIVIANLFFLAKLILIR